MASTKNVKRTPSGKITYRGETFSGYNQPARKKSFRARHKCDTAKDKFSARYWSCKAW